MILNNDHEKLTSNNEAIDNIEKLLSNAKIDIK